MLDGQEYLKWYSRLQEDRARRRLGFLRPDEGTMDIVDKIQLMQDRGEMRSDEPPTEDDIRNKLHLPFRTPRKE